MKTYFIVTSVIIATFQTAQADEANCLLEISNQTYIDGKCSFSSKNKEGGSFVIRHFDNFDQLDYVVKLYALRRGLEAEAYWGRQEGVNLPLTYVGTLHPDGACWRSDYAKICAWKPGEARGPEASKPTLAPPATSNSLITQGNDDPPAHAGAFAFVTAAGSRCYAADGPVSMPLSQTSAWCEDGKSGTLWLNVTPERHISSGAMVYIDGTPIGAVFNNQK